MPASTASPAATRAEQPSASAIKKLSAARPPTPAPTSGKAQLDAAIAPGSSCPATPTGSLVSTAIATANSSNSPRRASMPRPYRLLLIQVAAASSPHPPSGYCPQAPSPRKRGEGLLAQPTVSAPSPRLRREDRGEGHG